jgi:hypothetical protein
LQSRHVREYRTDNNDDIAEYTYNNRQYAITDDALAKWHSFLGGIWSPICEALKTYPDATADDLLFIARSMTDQELQEHSWARALLGYSKGGMLI